MSARPSLSALRIRTPLAKRARLTVEPLERRDTPNGATGHWSGTLFEPAAPEFQHYKIKFDLTQTGSNITGSEHIEIAGKAKYFGDWTITGTATATTMTLMDGALIANAAPLGFAWEQKTITLPLPGVVPSGSQHGDWQGVLRQGTLAVKHLEQPDPTLGIVTPGAVTDFFISTAPKMATVTASAVAMWQWGETTDLSNVSVQWTANLLFDGTETPFGKPNKPITVTKTTIGPDLTIDPAEWKKLRGGDLTLTATTTLNGHKKTATLAGLAIKGTNPTVAEVQAALGTDVLRQIAHQVSNYMQFDANGWPLFSADNKGAAGIMQVTPAKEVQQWDWHANVLAGQLKYQKAFHDAAIYYQSLQRSSAFKNLVKATNKDRVTNGLIPLTISLPAYTADQQTRDAIRGYNGWNGSDPFLKGVRLHEFRPALDAKHLLQIQLTSSPLDAIAIWEEVPAADRPQTVGDPDFVNKVLAQTP